MNTKSINNWSPVIGSLLSKLIKAGYALVAVDNGGGKVDTITKAKALEEINATDESHLYVKHPDDIKQRWIFIVLGNEPEETVNDFSFDARLETVMNEFADQWEGIQCPQIKA